MHAYTYAHKCTPFSHVLSTPGQEEDLSLLTSCTDKVKAQRLADHFTAPIIPTAPHRKRRQGWKRSDKIWSSVSHYARQNSVAGWNDLLALPPVGHFAAVAPAITFASAVKVPINAIAVPIIVVWCLYPRPIISRDNISKYPMTGYWYSWSRPFMSSIPFEFMSSIPSKFMSSILSSREVENPNHYDSHSLWWL